MTTEGVKDKLADTLHTQRWVTHDWVRLRDALDALPADELLRMGKDELRDSINRVLLEKAAAAAGVAPGSAAGVS